MHCIFRFVLSSHITYASIMSIECNNKILLHSIERVTIDLVEKRDYLRDLRLDEYKNSQLLSLHCKLNLKTTHRVKVDAVF